jgi:hypothetical protein
MITEWDSQFPGFGMHLRTIHRDGYTCTVYEPSTRDDNGLERMMDPRAAAIAGTRARTDIMYDGTEGELYNHVEDPRQWRNLWNDPGYARIKRELIDDLYGHMPAERNPKLLAEAPA